MIRYFGVGDTFQFKQRLNKTGCAALLAEELYEDNKMAGTMTSTSELTLRDVIDSFEILSSQEMQGNDSRERKMEVIQLLYKRCGSPLSLKYLVRSLNPTTGLRIGLSGKSLEKCFLKFAEDYNQASTIEEFERDIFGYRIGGESKVIMNIPFKPMIGRPSKTADEVIEHF